MGLAGATPYCLCSFLLPRGTSPPQQSSRHTPLVPSPFPSFSSCPHSSSIQRPLFFWSVPRSPAVCAFRLFFSSPLLPFAPTCCHRAFAHRRLQAATDTSVILQVRRRQPLVCPLSPFLPLRSRLPKQQNSSLPWLAWLSHLSAPSAHSSVAPSPSSTAHRGAYPLNQQS